MKLFGGGNGEAQRAAEMQRQQQQVANDRQLASLNSQDQESTASRRNPRGRRLFTEKDTLA